MRRALLAAVAALCAAAPSWAAERAEVVPAVPASVVAPAISAPPIALPSANGLSGSLALPAAASMPGVALPSAPSGAQAAAARAALSGPAAAVLPGENAHAAVAAHQKAPEPVEGLSKTSLPTLAAGISAIGGNAAGDRGGRTISASASRPDGETSARLDHDFDGSALRRSGSEDAPVVAGRASRWIARLSPSTRSFAKKAGLAAAALVLLASPVAQASTVAHAAGPIMTQSLSLDWLSAMQPIASAAGAVLGAIYGLIIARGKDSDTSGGDALAAALRYGVIGGASVYMLLDLTHLAFIGPGVGLKPLSAAVATAALGRAAFQGKFSDAATTSADRIVAAFPAVAAALGLSIGVNLAAPALSYTMAMTAMAVTGIVTAVYAAVFKLGRSPADGPGLMGKGFVLQSLMCGLALALTTPWQAWTFAIMGVAGFGLVLWAMGRELWSLVPRRGTNPPAQPKA